MRYIHTSKEGTKTAVYGYSLTEIREKLLKAVGVKKWEDLNLPIKFEISVNQLRYLNENSPIAKQ